MHKLTRKLCALLFALLLLPGCTSLMSEDQSVVPDQSDTSVADDSSDDINAAFESYTSQIFQTELLANTLNLHYTLASPADYGITSYEVTLGDYSKKAELNAYSTLENYITTLKSFDYDALDETNQLTYDILAWSFDIQLEGGQYNLFDDPLSPSLGIQAQLPVLLAEYTFYTKEDVSDYLTLLMAVPDYFNSILSFEQRKADAGLFMADFAVDEIITQCKEFIADPETNYLLEIFDDKVDALDDLTSEEKEEQKVRNEMAVQDYVIPAYEQLIAGLEDLRGSGTNDLGLAHYDSGQEYYEYLVRKYTGSSHSIDELQEMTEAQMTDDLLLMNQALTENPALLTEISLDDFTMTDPEEMLSYLEAAITEDFPALPEVSYEVKYVHKSLEDHLSPAFYLVPPLDDMDDHVIYLNGASSHEGIDLFTTLAHEGYPGHLYQTVYSASTSSDNVRSLFSFSGYVEGWATYVEMYSYYISGLDETTASLLQANNSFVLGLYASVDIGIHYSGWDIADTNTFLSEYGIDDIDVAEEIFQYIVEEPANYLKYYIGYVEFLNLRAEAEAQYGEDFVLKDFHEQILSIGPAPFSLLRTYILGTD